MSEAQKQEAKDLIIREMIKNNTHLFLDPNTGLPYTTRTEPADFMAKKFMSTKDYKIVALLYLDPLYTHGKNLIEQPENRTEAGSGYAIARKAEYHIYNDIEQYTEEIFDEDEEGNRTNHRKIKRFRSMESYWWVTFLPRQGSESKEVVLAVNSEQLSIHRDELVPVPQRFLNCADNARHPIYSSDGQISDRKIDGEYITFPYTRGPRSSYEEFQNFKRGVIKSREDVLTELADKHETVIN